MSVTLDLPPQLGEELREGAARAGLTMQEHVTLLLFLARAVIHDSFTLHPSVLEVVSHFLDDSLGDTEIPPELRATLRELRRREPRDARSTINGNGITSRPSAFGKYAHIGGTSEEFARAKRAEIEREDRRTR